MLQTIYMYQFRHTTAEDIPVLLGIIAQAQEYFKQQGIDQWQDGYPNAAVIGNDMRNNNSYVLLSDGELVATAMISFDGEPTYSHIDGAWLTGNPYAVIHRVAVKPDLKGQNIAGTIIRLAEDMCRERNIPCIRIDTHSENHSMQRVAAKCGFAYCGVIILTSGASRLAYEKIL